MPGPSSSRRARFGLDSGFAGVAHGIGLQREEYVEVMTRFIILGIRKAVPAKASAVTRRTTAIVSQFDYNIHHDLSKSACR